MNRNDDRDIFRNAANGMDPFRGTGSYTGSGRRWGNEDSQVARYRGDEWDRTNRSYEGVGDETYRRGQDWSRNQEGSGGRSYGMGSQGNYGYGRYGDDRNQAYGQSRYGYGYGQSEGMYGGGYQGGYGDRTETRGYSPWNEGRDRYGHDRNWTGRDHQHDFWGRDREHQRTLGERIGDWLGGHDDNRYGQRGYGHDEPGLWDKVKGVFTGKGPKGYTRSDDRIREDVCERLTYHPGIDAGEIDVLVKEGEVTLTGTVDDRRSKRLAEDIVEDIRGIRDVHNQLRVMPQTQQGLGTTGTTQTRTTGVTGTTSTTGTSNTTVQSNYRR